LPLYDYQCTECDCVTEVFSHMSSKTETVDCKECGALAKFAFTPSFKPKLKKTKKWQDVQPLKITTHSFVCHECNTKWDEIVDRDEDAPPQDGRDCLRCEAHAVWQPSCRIDRFSEQFPYYDRGLGVMLESKQQRREICKVRGLTPVEGDYDIESQYSKWDSQVEQETAEYDEYCDMLDNHPAYKDYRKQQDLGLI